MSPSTDIYESEISEFKCHVIYTEKSIYNTYYSTSNITHVLLLYKYFAINCKFVWQRQMIDKKRKQF